MSDTVNFFGSEKPKMTIINGVNAVLIKIKLKEKTVDSVSGFGRFGVPTDFKLLIESLAGEMVDAALFGINPTPNLSGKTNLEQITNCTNKIRENADWVKYTPSFEKTVDSVKQRFGDGELGFNITYPMIEPEIKDIKSYLESHGIDINSLGMPQADNTYDIGDKVSAGSIEGRVHGFWRLLNEEEKNVSLIFDPESDVEPIYPCSAKDADIICVDGNFFSAADVSLVFKDKDFDDGYLLDNHNKKLSILKEEKAPLKFSRFSVPKNLIESSGF